MIQLRCLGVDPKKSRFFPGDICEIIDHHMNDEMTKGVITIRCDKTKTTGPFTFSSEKNLVTKTEAFRVQLIPDEAP